jgi:hypothetical protein
MCTISLSHILAVIDDSDETNNIVPGIIESVYLAIVTVKYEKRLNEAELKQQALESAVAEETEAAKMQRMLKSSQSKRHKDDKKADKLNEKNKKEEDVIDSDRFDSCIRISSRVAFIVANNLSRKYIKMVSYRILKNFTIFK